MTRTSSFHRESENVFVTRESSLLMPKYQPLWPSAARTGSHFTRNFAPPRWYFLSASVAVGRYRPQSKSLPNPQQNSGAYANAGELGAGVQGRDVLPGIEQARGIEGGLHALEALDLRSRELHAHLVDLLDAHAVLAGDGAADLDAFFQHFARKALGAVELVGIVRVEKNQRGQIAVAGREHVGAAQVVFLLPRGGEFRVLAQ